MPNNKQQTLSGLPYVNTWQGIMITIAVNLLVAITLWVLGRISNDGFIMDALICGVTTSIISVVVIYPKIRKIRLEGGLPRQVPANKWLQKLPRKPVPLMIVLSILFAVIMGCFSVAMVWFFEIKTYTPLRFLVWKLVYSTVLSVKLADLVILRLMQPDCMEPGQPEQTGTAAIRNPLPRKETFRNLFNTVTDDFGFNMIMGLLLGGTSIVEGHNVLIAATTRAGIVIGGLILGFILSLRMVLPVIRTIKASRDAGQLPPLEKRTGIARLPEKPILLTLVLMLPIMIVSATVLWAVLTFFGFDILNFFQYFIVRTVYVSLLTKPVTQLIVLRYRQPDKNIRQGT